MTRALPDSSYGRIVRISAPLILSHTSVMLMQVVDGLFLARYSPLAIAAVGPAGMSAWVFIGLFTGLCGYSGTFVAQYVGAGKAQRAGAAVWQGMYVALAAGAMVAAMSLAADPLFAVMGHGAEIAALEVRYFRVMCWGGPVFLLAAALSGFFAGRNDNVRLMAVQLSGVAINALLDWMLIFGRGGLPELGIQGAAWATVIAQGAMVGAFVVLFLSPGVRRAYGTWSNRRADVELLKRLVRFGFPAGLRTIIEIVAWTVFLVFVGRVGEMELAASNIAWRLNGVAFFPLIGLAIAVSMLVGQAQGARQPAVAARVTWRGLLIGEVWMAVIAAAFVVTPGAMIAPFLDPARLSAAEYAQLAGTCRVLLRFVAAYCLLDAFNIFFLAALQGAGDTRWTLRTSAVVHVLYVAVLAMVVAWGGGLYALWTAATLFVMSIAGLWVARFEGGQWKSMLVIEPVVVASPLGPPGTPERPLGEPAGRGLAPEAEAEGAS